MRAQKLDHHVDNHANSNDFDICVGVITSVNGVKGYVKVRCFTESPKDIAEFNEVFNPETGSKYKLRVISAKKDYIIAGIEGVNNRNEAEKLRNTKLCIKRSELPKSKEEEYYHADLLGIEAFYEDGTKAGIIKNVVNFGAGDILDIYDLTSEKQFYHPFNAKCVTSIDINAKKVSIVRLEEIVASDE